jgi:hypothetical protein
MFIVHLCSSRLGTSYERESAEAAVDLAQKALKRGCAHVRIVDSEGRCFGPSDFSKILNRQRVSRFTQRLVWTGKLG